MAKNHFEWQRQKLLPKKIHKKLVKFFSLYYYLTDIRHLVQDFTLSSETLNIRMNY